jgi:hypothetical protein
MPALFARQLLLHLQCLSVCRRGINSISFVSAILPHLKLEEKWFGRKLLAGHVARIGEMRMHSVLWSENLKERDSFGDLDADRE